MAENVGISSQQTEGGIPSWLIEFMASQRAVNESLQQSNQQLASQLKTLTDQMAGKEPTDVVFASTTASTADTGVSGPVVKPKHSRRHPDPYTHEDESMYPQFRGGLEAKLRIDAAAIGQEEEKVWYALDCLKGNAAKRIYPWVEFAKDTDKFTVRELFTQMDLAFSDPQKKAKAIAKINKIEQGDRPFREFLQDFEQTLLEARGWAWDDSVKKGLLKAALSGELTGRLIGKEDPDDYASYCASIRRIADDLQAWKDTRKSRIRPVAQPTQASQQPAELMDWEPTRTSTVVATRTRQAGQDRPRAEWVTEAVRKQRWDSGACLRCGNQGHVQDECRLRPARPPKKVEEARNGPQKRTKVASTSTRKKAVAEEVFTDDESEDGDSGKV